MSNPVGNSHAYHCWISSLADNVPPPLIDDTKEEGTALSSLSGSTPYSRASEEDEEVEKGQESENHPDVAPKDTAVYAIFRYSNTFLCLQPFAFQRLADFVNNPRRFDAIPNSGFVLANTDLGALHFLPLDEVIRHFATLGRPPILAISHSNREDLFQQLLKRVTAPQLAPSLPKDQVNQSKELIRIYKNNIFGVMDVNALENNQIESTLVNNLGLHLPSNYPTNNGTPPTSKEGEGKEG